MDNIAARITQFVSLLNSEGLEPLFDRDVPQELRIRELVDIRDMFKWEIRPAESNPWVSALESMLPHPFPALYRSLITRFRFAEFEVGPVMFLANTGKDVFNELSRVMFADEGLYPPLLQQGLLQFGKQAGGHYDPVCFAMRRCTRDDAPIVQIDHEDVLIRNRVRITSEIAPSFEAFVERFIAGKFKKKRSS